MSKTGKYTQYAVMLAALPLLIWLEIELARVGQLSAYKSTEPIAAVFLIGLAEGAIWVLFHLFWPESRESESIKEVE